MEVYRICRIPDPVVPLLGEAAALGHGAAQYMLDEYLRFDQGISMDSFGAFACYRRSAEGGNPSVKAGMARYFGASRDSNHAYILAREAAESGAARGTCLYGFCLKDGVRVPRDAEAAASWYRKGGRAGRHGGRGRLGRTIGGAHGSRVATVRGKSGTESR